MRLPSKVLLAARVASLLLTIPTASGLAAPGDSTATGAASAALAPPGIPVNPTAPDYPCGKISGYMFGDAYYDVVGDPKHLYDSKGLDQGQANIDENKTIGKDLNGVQVRRVYFQLDNDLTARIATRFRLEMDGKELTSGGKLGVAVKNAYLQAKSVYPRGDLYFGVLATPTFENSETFWQYRSIEKTVIDFLGLRRSADLGLELKGYIDPDHHFGYSAMMGDGPGQKPENDRFKTWYLALPIRFGDLRVEPYVDYQPVRVDAGKAAVSDTAVNNDQAMYKIFAGYEFRRFAIGVEAFDRVNHLGAKKDTEPRGLSVFGRGTITSALAAFARVDKQLWIGGLDWQTIKDVHVMPNVEATQYIAKGTGVVPPHHDLQARITFYYLFSRPQS
jgi:hypothetical protein